jgi:N utilization substance protein B
MASRRKGRILAFQALYAWDAARLPLEDLIAFRWLEAEKRDVLEEELKTFARLLISGTIENIEAVDANIQKHLEHWSLERLKKVDLAVLRLSAYSLLYQKDIPPQITIRRAIEIVKEYGSEDSYRFVNGLIGSIWKSETTTPCSAGWAAISALAIAVLVVSCGSGNRFDRFLRVWTSFWGGRLPRTRGRTENSR